MKPPSRWHDDAYRRDAGHDGMQAEFVKFARDRPIVFGAESLVSREVQAEKPLYRLGQIDISGYADVYEMLTFKKMTVVNLYEIKPRIYTTFGTIRQLEETLSLGNQTFEHVDQIYCFAVVPAEDPKIGELRAEWPLVWAWGIKFDVGERDE